MRTLTPSQWTAKYRPTLGPHGGVFLEKQPEADTQHTWSLINRRGDKFIVPGIISDALMFAVTERPYIENEIVFYEVH